MHDLSHIERVLKYVEKLVKSIDYKVDMDILIYVHTFMVLYIVVRKI